MRVLLWLFPFVLNDNIVDIENNDGICSPTFVVNKFLGYVYILNFFSIKYLRSVNVILSDILVPSEGIIILQKSLCSHTVYPIQVCILF